MAEFSEIIKLRQRMCEYYNCCDDENSLRKCPLNTAGNKENHFIKSFDADSYDYECECELIEFLNEERLRWFEKTVLNWAAANPEPKYPTWYQWWEENFKGEGRRMLEPCAFVSPKELGCSIEHDGCMQAPFKCWHKPIPAHVAKKLGVKPLSEEIDVPSGDTLPDSKSSSHGDVFVVKC